MLVKNELLKLLNDKSINYKKYDHEPLYSVEDSKNKRGEIRGSHTKNLFLKNKKNQFFLFSCDEKSLVDLKKFSKAIGFGNLSFAKEEYLGSHLGVKAGSVSPYALLNDINNEVIFYLDIQLYTNEYLNFHPLINTSTITTKTNDFIKFMIENKKKIHIFSLNEYRVLKKI